MRGVSRELITKSIANTNERVNPDAGRLCSGEGTKFTHQVSGNLRTDIFFFFYSFNYNLFWEGQFRSPSSPHCA